MRRSGSSVAIVLILASVVAAVAARPPAPLPEAAAAADIDARFRQAEEANAFNRYLAAELTAGRLRLAEAIDQQIEGNAHRPDYHKSLHVSVGGATLRESVARSLVFRAEHPLATPPVELPAVRAEYAALFGRPYVPPCG
jgi:hypothetical protein